MSIKKRQKRIKKVATAAKKTIINSVQKVPETALVIKQEVLPKTPKTSLTTHIKTLGKTVSTKLRVEEGSRSDKWIATAASVVLMLGTIWIGGRYVPELYKLTSLGGVEELNKQAENRKTEREAEDIRIQGVNKVVMKTNFGDIELSLFRAETPVTNDNFLRLADRKKYDNNVMHRMVKSDGFAVIQGGDYGGVDKDQKSLSVGALTATIQDELWKVFPEFNEQGGLTNQPVLNVSTAYSGYAVLGKSANETIPQQQITIKKGYLAMAKTSSANSGGSQFFYTLADTTLPADYTVFAKVADSSISILDKISGEVDPVDGSGNKTLDGKPSKEVKILSIEFKK
jgi:cyclophilin family peptidyl-prolyl cis-trans isomerase